MNQMFFKRYELKYLMTRRQQTSLLRDIDSLIVPEKYAHSSIRNLYYDTDQYRLIRQSLEKPVYKEKLRMRSYGRAGESDPVFVELKKKYESIVFKRRLEMPQADALKALEGEKQLPKTQIGREVSAAISFYETLQPRVYISYERDSFLASDGSDIRITFDTDIRYRTDKLTLDSEPGGECILPEDQVLMELKIPESMPLWLARALSRQSLGKTTFSKYGEAYTRMLNGNMKGDLQYV